MDIYVLSLARRAPYRDRIDIDTRDPKDSSQRSSMVFVGETIENGSGSICFMKQAWLGSFDDPGWPEVPGKSKTRNVQNPWWLMMSWGILLANVVIGECLMIQLGEFRTKPSSIIHGMILGYFEDCSY